MPGLILNFRGISEWQTKKVALTVVTITLISLIIWIAYGGEFFYEDTSIS